MEKKISDDLLKQIEKCWDRNTSSDPEGWNKSNPAWGQCVVTACLVQDLIGGEIVWTNAISPDQKEYSHYFNVLSDGTIIDITQKQFPIGTKYSHSEGIIKTQSKCGKEFANTREYVLSYPSTMERYQRLSNRFQQYAG